jgi:hypothetical protein
VPNNAELINTLYFEGIATNLKPNDPLLLIYGNEENAFAFFRQVESVKADAIQDLTTVTLQEVIGTRQAFMNTVEVIRQTLAKHQNLAAFSVSESTQMAGRVVSSLRRFNDKLSAGQTFEDLKVSFAEELPLLREEQAIAEEGDYAKLGPWVTGLVAELDEHERTLSTAGRPAGQGRASGLAGTGGGGGESRGEGELPLASLVSLVSPLLQPPSEQPPHARQLRRDVQTIFASESDTVPRLLTKFKPKLQDTLYAAWAQAEFTDPPALNSVQAPRVKASPFGHNAPLKPIFDEEGVLIGQEEWPLIGSVAFRVDLLTTQYGGILSGFRSGRLTADIAVTLGGEQLKARVGLEDPSITLQLDGVTVEITLTEEHGSITSITFRFEGSFESGGGSYPVNKTLSIEPNDQYTMLSITIDSDPNSTRSIQPGYQVSFPFANSKVTLSFENEEEFFVTDESLIPPTALDVVALDTEYNQITPGSWVAIKRADRVNADVFQVLSADTVSLAAYGISGKVTQLTLDGEWLTLDDLLLAVLRQTTIYAQSEKLTLAEEPIDDDVAGDSIELDALYDGLEAGRWVIVSGERTDIGSNSRVQASELMMLSAVTQGVYQLEVDEGSRGR